MARSIVFIIPLDGCSYFQLCGGIIMIGDDVLRAKALFSVSCRGEMTIPHYSRRQNDANSPGRLTVNQ